MKRALVAVALCAACEAVPKVPDTPITRAVVVSDVELRGVGAPNDCARACPAPLAGETIAYCHGATMDRTLVEHRAELGDRIAPDAGSSPIVCTYGRTP